MTVITPSNEIGDFFHADNGSSMPATSYGRGAGTIPTTCPAGYSNSGLLCVQNCPSGYTDTGLMCTYSGALTVACDGWDWAGAHCASCPANYTDAGAFCAADSFSKANDGSPSCAAGQEEQAGLCYPLCDPGYSGVGPVCWLNGISGIVGAYAGFIEDSSNNTVGTTSALSLGVGESPVQLGFSNCQTTVTQLW